MSALGLTGLSAFRVGYAAGLSHYLLSLYWLLHIPFPAGAIAGWLALSGYLSIYIGLWVWLCWRLFPRNLRDLPANHSGSGLIERFVACPLLSRAGWAITCGMLWVAMEMLIGRVLTGFPWNFLGVSQFRMLALVQIAPFTGVYGISFLMAWFSVALAATALVLIGRPVATRLSFGDLMLPLAVVAAVASYGIRELNRPQFERPTVKIALIQPSIPQTLIWDPAENTNRFRQLLDLSRRALSEKPDLLIWPEAAVPNLLRYEQESLDAILEMVLEHRVWMILGADDAVPRPGAREGDLRAFDYFNSSFVISPVGRIEASYRKRRLVIFGEYVPFAKRLPFLKKLTPIGEGFSAGDKPEPFHLSGLDIRTSVLICFEDTFPHLAREYVSEDTDFLLNLTNNGWFGESAAQWQHAANSVFRAIENRVPLVRSANNGLTCWVDEFGRMSDVFFPGTTDIYGAGYKLVHVPVLAPGEQREPTWYQRHGDVFGWSCVVLAAVFCGRRTRGLRWGSASSRRRLQTL